MVEQIPQVFISVTQAIHGRTVKATATLQLGATEEDAKALHELINTYLAVAQEDWSEDTDSFWYS